MALNLIEELVQRLQLTVDEARVVSVAFRGRTLTNENSSEFMEVMGDLQETHPSLYEKLDEGNFSEKDANLIGEARNDLVAATLAAGRRERMKVKRVTRPAKKPLK